MGQYRNLSWLLFGHIVSGICSSNVSVASAYIAGMVGMVGPFLFTGTFAYFVDKGRDWTPPGAPFLLASGLLLIALLLANRFAAARSG